MNVTDIIKSDIISVFNNSNNRKYESDILLDLLISIENSYTFDTYVFTDNSYYNTIKRILNDNKIKTSLELTVNKQLPSLKQLKLKPNNEYIFIIYSDDFLEDNEYYAKLLKNEIYKLKDNYNYFIKFIIISNNEILRNRKNLFMYDMFYSIESNKTLKLIKNRFGSTSHFNYILSQY